VPFLSSIDLMIVLNILEFLVSLVIPFLRVSNTESCSNKSNV